MACIYLDGTACSGKSTILAYLRGLSLEPNTSLIPNPLFKQLNVLPAVNSLYNIYMMTIYQQLHSLEQIVLCDNSPAHSIVSQGAHQFITSSDQDIRLIWAQIEYGLRNPALYNYFKSLNVIILLGNIDEVLKRMGQRGDHNRLHLIAQNFLWEKLANLFEWPIIRENVQTTPLSLAQHRIIVWLLNKMHYLNTIIGYDYLQLENHNHLPSTYRLLGRPDIPPSLLEHLDKLNRPLLAQALTHYNAQIETPI